MRTRRERIEERRTYHRLTSNRNGKVHPPWAARKGLQGVRTEEELGGESVAVAVAVAVAVVEDGSPLEVLQLGDPVVCVPLLRRAFLRPIIHKRVSLYTCTSKHPKVLWVVNEGEECFVWR